MPVGQGRRAITRDIYDALLEAYRAQPGNHSAAARYAKVTRATAKNAWEKGWPARSWPAIKDDIQREQLEARQRVAELAAKEVELAEREKRLKAAMDREAMRVDALKRREDWSRAAMLARGNAVAAMGVQAELLRGALEQVKQWRAQLATANLSAPGAVKLLRELTGGVLQAHEALKVAQQVEHLALGEPTDIFGLAGVLEAGNVEEAAADIDLAARALARARHRGLVLPPVDTTAEDSDAAPGGNGKNGSNGAGGLVGFDA